MDKQKVKVTLTVDIGDLRIQVKANSKKEIADAEYFVADAHLILQEQIHEYLYGEGISNE